MGELGVVMAEAWRGRGVGAVLVRQLVEVGRRHEVKGLPAEVVVSNPGMVGILRRVDLIEVPFPDDGIYALRFAFEKELSPSARGMPWLFVEARRLANAVAT
jgi:GNAT superfamily N-acetyltransferase